MLMILAGIVQYFFYAPEIQIIMKKEKEFPHHFQLENFCSNYKYFEIETWCGLILGPWMLYTAKNFTKIY